jgi:hypothetical protein
MCAKTVSPQGVLLSLYDVFRIAQVEAIPSKEPVCRYGYLLKPSILLSFSIETTIPVVQGALPGQPHFPDTFLTHSSHAKHSSLRENIVMRNESDASSGIQ